MMRTRFLLFSAAMIALVSSSSAAVVLAAGEAPAPAPGPSPGGDQASCVGIVTSLRPCLDFLRGKEAAPSKSCCSGAKELNDELKTKKDRQEACKCIKNAVKSFDSIDSSRIPEIPKQCKIPANLPPIDADFDCSTITSVYAGLITN